MGAKEVAGAITVVGGAVIGLFEKEKDTILGKYSDGTTRNIPDAINGETLSAKDKEKTLKRVKKKKKTKLKL